MATALNTDNAGNIFQAAMTSAIQNQQSVTCDPFLLTPEDPLRQHARWQVEEELLGIEFDRLNIGNNDRKAAILKAHFCRKDANGKIAWLSIQKTAEVTDQANAYANLMRRARNTFVLPDITNEARNRFLSMEEKSDWNILDFDAALSELKNLVDYGNDFDARKLEVLVTKTKDTRFREKCIMENYDYAQAMAYARRLRSIRLTNKAIGKTTSSSVNAVRGGQRISACRFCNRVHPPKRCPAYGKTCLRCHGKNHFQNTPMCKAGSSNNSQQNQFQTSNRRGNFNNRGRGSYRGRGRGGRRGNSSGNRYCRSAQYESEENETQPPEDSFGDSVERQVRSIRSD